MSCAGGQCHHIQTDGLVSSDPKTEVVESPPGTSDPSHLSSLQEDPNVRRSPTT